MNDIVNIGLHFFLKNIRLWIMPVKLTLCSVELFFHSDRGTQYTSELYRKDINKYGILQSMNSAGGRCHDNARCESMWARFKEELLYGRYDIFHFILYSFVGTISSKT